MMCTPSLSYMRHMAAAMDGIPMNFAFTGKASGLSSRLSLAISSYSCMSSSLRLFREMTQESTHWKMSSGPARLGSSRIKCVTFSPSRPLNFEFLGYRTEDATQRLLRRLSMLATNTTSRSTCMSTLNENGFVESKLVHLCN
jgi:hypothetical protein